MAAAKTKPTRTKKKSTSGAKAVDVVAEISRAYGELTKALEESIASKEDKIAVLHSALEAWRFRPVPTLSILIEKLSQHIHEGDKLLAEGGGEERESRWKDLASTSDPKELGRLLNEPWPHGWPAALERVACLDAFPPDPRITMAYVRLIDEMPYASGLSGKLWSAVTRRLAQTVDPRATNEFFEVSLKPSRFAHPYRIQAMYTRTRAAMAKSSAALTKEGSPLGQNTFTDLESAIAKLDATPLASRAKAKGEAEFLAEIWADPHDEGLREVYCDWLLERGDPRGEFMRLQLERARSLERGNTDANEKREVELFNELRARLCGRLAPIAQCILSDFERGFLAQGHFDVTDDAQVAMAAGLGEWSTVEQIEIPSSYYQSATPSTGPLIETLLTKSPMRSLRAIHGLHPEPAQALCRLAASSLSSAVPTHLHEISILSDPSRNRDGGVEICRELELPTSVTRVGIVGLSAPFDWLFGSRMWRSPTTEHVWLRRFGQAAHAALESILLHASTSAPQLKSFELGGWCWQFRKLVGWGAEYTRDEAGVFSRLTIRWGPLQARNRPTTEIANLVLLLEKIPADLPREIVFKVPMKRLMRVDREAIEKQLARFHRLEKCVAPWDL